LYYRQPLLPVGVDLLVEERRYLDAAGLGGFPRSLDSREEEVVPKPAGLATNDVDGPMHVADRKPVEREPDVEAHLRQEPGTDVMTLKICIFAKKIGVFLLNKAKIC
jgi:hypothetical protein